MISGDFSADDARKLATSKLLALAYNQSTQGSLFNAIVGSGVSHDQARAEIERILGLVLAEIDRRFPVPS